MAHKLVGGTAKFPLTVDWNAKELQLHKSPRHHLVASSPCMAAVYVGNLAPNTTDVELRQLAQMYGVVKDVKLYRKGSYAFIHFQDHQSAVNAIAALNGRVRFVPDSGGATSTLSL